MDTPEQEQIISSSVLFETRDALSGIPVLFNIAQIVSVRMHTSGASRVLLVNGPPIDLSSEDTARLFSLFYIDKGE